MKITNILLVILICLVGWQKSTVVKDTGVISKDSGIKVGKTTVQTRDITPIVKDKGENKHASTFRNYIDSDGRTTTSMQHSVRVGKDYYISGGVTSRQSSYNSNSYGADISVTKYW